MCDYRLSHVLACGCICLHVFVVSFAVSLTHPAHNQHQLALIQHPSSFLFQFHDKHPLILSFSLPQVYHKFEQHCRLCNKILSRLNWIYYRPRCRFFAHFQCARSGRMLRLSSSGINETYNPDLVHLPAADEASAYLSGEQFVKAMSTLNNMSDGIFSATNGIKHWAHDEHPLQLITMSELFDEMKEDAKMLLLCDACVKPIRTHDGLFYGCVPCKYFLHKFCAELPRDMEHHFWPDFTLHAAKYSKPYMSFHCECCGLLCNGIFFGDSMHHGLIFTGKLHIGCAALPRMIIHDAHPHKLNQIYSNNDCKACGIVFYKSLKHGCEECDFYICGLCITNSKTVKHPWDPHPLHLIYEIGMVIDHEHDFNCEFCSEDIDTNFWFYHCGDFDLSFHLRCFKKSCHRKYANIKFGATGIIIDKLHHHSLTFVLNKTVRRCEKCHSRQLGKPVLQCEATCKAIFCRRCIEQFASA